MAETIEIQTPDGPAEALLAGERGKPGVLFYMDAIGLRPQIEDMAERIASWGYVVLAPNVFHREGRAADLAPDADLRDPEVGAAFMPLAMTRVRALTAELAERDAEAWVRTLEEYAGEGPIGVTGYCMGARLAVRTAGWYPGTVAAVGGWHGGGLVTEEPDSPHLAVNDSTAEFVFGHADHDRSMPLEAVERLEQALQEADRPHINEVYAGAAHGYTMADTSAYDHSAAERHYAGLKALLDRAL